MPSANEVDEAKASVQIWRGCGLAMAESPGAIVPSHESNPLDPSEDPMVNVTVYTNIG